MVFFKEKIFNQKLEMKFIFLGFENGNIGVLSKSKEGKFLQENFLLINLS